MHDYTYVNPFCYDEGLQPPQYEHRRLDGDRVIGGLDAGEDAAGYQLAGQVGQAHVLYCLWDTAATSP